MSKTRNTSRLFSQLSPERTIERMLRAAVMIALLSGAGMTGAACTRAADIPVANGEELSYVLSGGEFRGHILDDGDTVTLTGTETIFSVPETPEPYYKGFSFAVRTSPGRPKDKRQVTIKYTGAGEADLFTMTAGKVDLSNILLEGWTPHACCGPY